MRKSWWQPRNGRVLTIVASVGFVVMTLASSCGAGSSPAPLSSTSTTSIALPAGISLRPQASATTLPVARNTYTAGECVMLSNTQTQQPSGVPCVSTHLIEMVG